VLQAMLLDPVVDSVGSAERILDEMLKTHAEYLPQF
jgi:alpha-galactosidase/6-phospho-beta-glucosidase family protein